ncbi:AMP-binding protein [Nitrospira sp. KM1]|uniref:AMP-binding protein n=1 Tax=Nitrospira sp. KM1 TaxID=1936990 RepID=UPI001565A889|nr:AMP-binding protein [Nitrospira sp. KM1]
MSTHRSAATFESSEIGGCVTASPWISPLVRYAELDAPFAWRKGTTVTVRHFLSAVWRLAARLPSKRHVINLCNDRYYFAVGFGAALVRRQISLLPTCRAAEPLQQLSHEYEDVYVLADHADVPSGLSTFAFPEDVQRVAPAPHNPLISIHQLAAIVFTSGSSGCPQAHAKRWGSLIQGAHALRRQFDLGRKKASIAVGTVPAQHMYGLETTIMLPLQCGWGIHAGMPILPADIMADIEQIDLPVWLMTTPVHLRAYMGQGAVLTGLEGIISATMPLTASLAQDVERSWSAPVYEIYGCTEGGIIASRRTVDGKWWQLCDGLNIRQNGEETWVSGGHVGTALKLTDRIVVGDDRTLDLLGSSYDLVKVAGKRASLAALNNALTRISGVVDGTFFWPDQGRTGTGRLSAFIVAPGISRSRILGELRKRIDPVFLPRPLYLVDALPRNTTGKLPRERLEAFANRLKSCPSVRG